MPQEYGHQTEQEDQSPEQPRRVVSKVDGVPDAEAFLYEDGGIGGVEIEDAELPALVGRAIAAAAVGAADTDEAPQKRDCQGQKSEGDKDRRQVAERVLREQRSERNRGQQERHAPDPGHQELQNDAAQLRAGGGIGGHASARRGAQNAE